MVGIYIYIYLSLSLYLPLPPSLPPSLPLSISLSLSLYICLSFSLSFFLSFFLSFSLSLSISVSLSLSALQPLWTAAVCSARMAWVHHKAPSCQVWAATSVPQLSRRYAKKWCNHYSESWRRLWLFLRICGRS